VRALASGKSERRSCWLANIARICRNQGKPETVEPELRGILNSKTLETLHRVQDPAEAALRGL
jgi:hypothetical protein